MKLIAAKEFTLKNVYYAKGDEVTVSDKQELILLNEKGFIEPLTRKEIQNFEKEVKKSYKKEEE